jgi:ABC-2 type transport system ATP-binding protein
MSTHSLSLAEEIADLIGVVDGGRLMFLGTLAELRGQAAHGHTSLEELYLALTATDDERPPVSGKALAAGVGTQDIAPTASQHTGG